MTTEVANMIIEKIDRILNDNIFEGINIHYFGRHRGMAGRLQRARRLYDAGQKILCVR